VGPLYFYKINQAAGIGQNLLITYFRLLKISKLSMRLIIPTIFLTSFLFSIEGIIVFYDQTIIEGEISSVNNNSVIITPSGLNFAEEILLQNIDSLKTNNGMVPIAGGKIFLFYNNGEFSDAQKSTDNIQNLSAQISYDDVEYVIVPNWSLNLYTGYPIIKAKSFEEFDESNIVYGLSVGSPYGFFAGDFFMNVIAEFAYYRFQQKNNLLGQDFGGPAFQIGLSPGFFIGNTSFSMTACTGVYEDDLDKLTAGFIGGGSIDIPLGEIIVDKYGSFEIFKGINLLIGQIIDYKIFDGLRIKDIEDQMSSFEMRITGRSNLIQKKDGYTGWLGMGISFGYEFDYGGHPKLPDWLSWPF